MLVRRMQEQDLEQVMEIEETSFTSPWSKEDFIKSMRQPQNCYLVAEEGTLITGYCGFWGVPPEGQVNNVAVRESCRSRGIGYIMLSELLAAGKQMGLTEFTLEVRVSNSRAISLYEKLGFEDCGRRKGFYSKPMEDAIIMWKVEENHS